MRRAISGALVVALALAACSSGGDDDKGGAAKHATPTTIGRAGSVRDSTVPSIAIGEPLDSYAVTYRVETARDGAVRTSTATLAVDRPFRSRLELRSGSTVESLSVADFSLRGTRTATGGATVLTAVPAAAPDDVRTDLVAGEGTGEVRTVLRRRCEVHRFGAPLLGGGDRVVHGAAVDACIDAEGLVLEQVARRGRSITSRWVATEVDTSAHLGAADVSLPDVAVKAADDGGGSVQPIDPASAPQGTFWQLDAPPAGFVRRGRYAVVPPQSARLDDENTRAKVVAGIVDVFVRGRDVLIVDQGGTLGQVPPFGTDPNSTLVDAGELARNAEWFLTPTGAELRALLPPGHYVKVLGTLTPDEIIAVARQLHPIEGQGITYR